MKSVSELTPPPIFELNPSKNKTVGKKLDFDPKTRNGVTTADQ